MTKALAPRSSRRIAVLTTVGLAAGLVVALPSVAQAASCIVTSNAESGAGSLQQAILDANNSLCSGAIDFDLPSGQTDITLTTPFNGIQVLPPITAPVVIDATTNPTGQVAILAGPGLGASRLFQVGSDDVAIRGFAVGGSSANNSFGDAVIDLVGHAQTEVSQNLFGLTADGTATSGSQLNNAVTLVGSTSATVTANYVSNASLGIALDTPTDGFVSQNIVGLTTDETTGVSVNTGIEVTGGTNTSISGNTVAGTVNNAYGIRVVSGTDIFVVSNRVGTRPDGSGAFPGRGGGGILVDGSAAAATGVIISSNTVSHGLGDGIVLDGGNLFGIGASVTANDVTSNGGSGIQQSGAVVGTIDLGGNDISSNQVLGVDTGFAGVNSPPDGPATITSAVDGQATLDLAYDGPAGAQDARVDVSLNSTCDAGTQGETYAAAGTVALNGAGDFTGTVDISTILATGENLTVQVTPLGSGVSTEYSSCYTVTSGGAPGADLGVAPLVDTPDPVTGGGLVQYTTTVTNDGPDDATGVDVTLFGDSSVSLPAFTTFVSGTAGSTTCTSVSGGAVHCPVGTLANGASIPVSIVLQADAVSSPSGIPVTVAATGSLPDPNGANDSSSTFTTINPANGDEATTYVPPSNTPTTVSDAPTVVAGGEPQPVATATDTTAALIVVPAGGPGGAFTVADNDCTGVLFCSTTLLNNRVVTFTPPQTSAALAYYDWQHPLRYTMTFDATTVGGLQPKKLKVRYEKDSVPGVLQTARYCPKPLTASTVFPCISTKRFVRSSNPDINGDLRVRLFATANDPKIGTYR